MRWLVPQSLFGRWLAALVAVIGAFMLVIVALLVRERSELLSEGSETAAIVAAIAGTVATLAELAPGERAAQIERLERGTLLISSAGQSRQSPRFAGDVEGAARTLRGRLEDALGAGYTVAVARAVPGPAQAIRVGRGPRRWFERGGMSGPGFTPRERGLPVIPAALPPELDVAVTLRDGAVVAFRTDVPRGPPPLPVGLVLQLLAVTLVFAGVLYAMARTVTRPLGDLAAAAEAVGRGARFAPLRESGARELRHALRAFNTMQERLHRYLDSRTRVLSAMSHDLRTPLTRLKLRVETLEDEALRERFNADLDEMNRMVTGALRLFAGLNHDERLVSVRVEDLLEELRAEFAEIGDEVRVSGATREPIEARRDALKRCLTNLLSNAIKYGQRAHVLVADEGGNVVVRVADDGPGIPEAMLEAVFEPFFRLETSRNADTGGTGLGLSIARDVAQAHGGSLVLRNRKPQGLEAVLRLPRSTGR